LVTPTPEKGGKEREPWLAEKHQDPSSNMDIERVWRNSLELF
jgi:hypothetical protein